MYSNPIAGEDGQEFYSRVTSEGVRISRKKWGLEAAEFFARGRVFNVPQTVQKLSGAVHKEEDGFTTFSVTFD